MVTEWATAVEKFSAETAENELIRYREKFPFVNNALILAFCAPTLFYLDGYRILGSLPTRRGIQD